MTEKKKGRKPSRERMPVKGTTSGAIEGALSVLEDLRQEFQDIIDNTSEGLQQTERHQTREATVDALDFVDEGAPELPEWASDVPCEWIENQHPKASRAARCANAVAALNAARDALENAKDDKRELLNEAEKAEETDTPEEAEAGIDCDELSSEIDQVEEAINSLDEWIGNAEGTEWPGMFG